MLFSEYINAVNWKFDMGEIVFALDNEGEYYYYSAKVTHEIIIKTQHEKQNIQNTNKSMKTNFKNSGKHKNKQQIKAQTKIQIKTNKTT